MRCSPEGQLHELEHPDHAQDARRADQPEDHEGLEVGEASQKTSL